MTHDALLDIQRLDVEAHQLRHRRVTLAAREKLDSTKVERAQMQTRVDEVRAQRVEVATRQRRFEDEAQIVSAKVEKDEAQLYGGEISGMKDLQALQDEIAGLRGRQGELEDRALEAMEEAETFDADLGALAASAAELDETMASLALEIVAAETEIDESLAMVSEQRGTAAEQVDGAHLEEYERLRPGFGTATVVRFAGGNCVGCPSTMPAVEADRMKHSDEGEVLSCNECGRMVLR